MFFKLTSSPKVIVIVDPVLFTPDAPSAGETEETVKVLLLLPPEVVLEPSSILLESRPSS